MHPIFKGGGKDKTEPSSYRPVAVLPAISKVLERIVCNQLVSYLEEHNLLPEQQHGFRKGRSTGTALVNALYKWDKLKQSVGIVTFDYTAAFDTLDFHVIKEKLIKIGADDNTIKWFMCYLDHGRQRVNWNGSVSALLLVNWGVRQGSILGPVIYIIVTSDTPSILGENMLAYADDTSIWDPSVHELTKCGQKLIQYSHNIGLVLNPSKTQYMRMGRQDSNLLTIGQESIPPNTSITILGLELDYKLSPGPYIDSMISSLTGRLGILRRLRAQLPCNVLALVAKGLLLGKAQVYAEVVFNGRLSESEPVSGQAQKLQVILNDTARLLLGLRRKNHVSIRTLMDKSGLSSINHIVVRSSGMMTWKLSNPSHVLHPIFLESLMDSRTRSASDNNLRIPELTNGNRAIWNGFRVWNKCKELRESTTERQAKRALKLFLRTVPI